MRGYFYGFYNQSTQFKRVLQYYGGRGSTVQICSLFPLKREFNSKLVVEAFITSVVKIHCFPKTIVSHKDRVFMSFFWQQLFKSQGTILAMSSSYHLKSDGQTKNLKKTVEMYLICVDFDYPKAWSLALPWVKFWYNTSFHHSTRMTPFKTIFCCDPSKIFPYQCDPTDPLSLQESLMSRDTLLQQLKQNMCKAKNYMKAQLNKKRLDFHLEWETMPWLSCNYIANIMKL